MLPMATRLHFILLIPYPGRTSLPGPWFIIGFEELFEV